MARGYTRPNKEFESPFKHLHQYQPMMGANNSSVFEELYAFTISSPDKEELWVSSDDPFSISLKLETIQEAVKEEKVLNAECFNLAVRNLLAEDAENLKNTKCLGWRHYVYQRWVEYAILGVEYCLAEFTRTQFCHSSTAYDAFSSHLVLIPVFHAGHWTLYAFNMCNRKLSILDSMTTAEERHKNIRLHICGALNQTMGRAFDESEDDFRMWEFQFPRVPIQQNSWDSGFFVFNFMRLWDGHQLIQSFSTESRKLRKDFLAYLLSYKGNMATLPLRVASWVNILTGQSNPMDSRLQKAIIEGDETEFKKLLDSEPAAPTTVIDMPPAPQATTDGKNSPTSRFTLKPLLAYCCHCLLLVGCCRRSTAAASSPNSQTDGAAADSQQAQPTSGADQHSWPHVVTLPPQLIISSVLLRGVTSIGDGVLHIAARHGHEALVRAIFRRVGVHIEEHPPPPPSSLLLLPPPPPTIVGIPNEHHQTEDAAHDGQEITAAGGTITEATEEQGELQFAEFLRARNQMGETCLHEAVRTGNNSLVYLLVAVDASLNDASSPALVQILDNDGVSPLYLATTLRMVKIVEAFTTRDCKYSVPHGGPDGKTALHAAVLLSPELCKLLLSWNKSLAKSKDKLGRTPLHYLGTSDTEITDLILDCDPLSGYCADSEGSLPIHVAASRGRLDIIKRLLEKCASSASMCNASGQTFLHVAVQNGQRKIVYYFSKKPQFSSVVNMRDHNGDTALHIAVKNGNDYIFRKLLRNKQVRLSFINKKGYTPLDLAFLSMDEDPIHKQRKRQWIRNDLLAVGADFCTCRSDHFNNVSKHDNEEKESERLRNSAALFAAGALLVLTTSLQAPFNIADKKLQANISSLGGNNVTTASAPSSTVQLSALLREHLFATLSEVDAVSLTAAVLSIFFCTLAGFPMSGHGFRFAALFAGGACLFVAALTIIVVFVLGLSMVYPGMKALYIVYVLFGVVAVFAIVVAYMTTSPAQITSHAMARIRRLGFKAGLRSFSPFCPGKSWIPLLQVIFLVFNVSLLVSGACISVLLFIKDTSQHAQDIFLQQNCNAIGNCTRV